MTHSRRNAIYTIPTIIFALAACGDPTLAGDPAPRPGASPHQAAQTDGWGGDATDSGSGSDGAESSGSESAASESPASESPASESGETQTDDASDRPGESGESDTGGEPPPAGGAYDWTDEVELFEDGVAPDEATRTRLLGALEPMFLAYLDEARAAGATFRLVVRWDGPTEGAQAVTRPGRIWEVIVEGGLAHTPIDRITLVGCHEMGHLIGGFPFLGGVEIIGSDGGPRTAEEHALIGTSEGAEGQADYFATKECLPRTWGNDDNSPYEALVAPELKTRCDAVYGDPTARQLCYRILVSSLDKTQSTYSRSIFTWDECEAEGMWDLPECEDLIDPSPTSSPRVVEPKILTFGYPTRICRLETYVRGALCPIKYPRPLETGGSFVVPGDVETPWGYGIVTEESRSAAAPHACQGDHPGARPACWYNEDVALPGCEGTGLQPGESVCEDGASRNCGTPLRADDRGPTPCRRGCNAEGTGCMLPPTD